MQFTHGAGDGVKTGCLMTMSNVLVGHGEDTDKSTDHNKVCTVMRSFIMSTNDTIPVDILAKVYGPLAEKILGTITSDPKVLRERAIMFAEWSDEIPLPPKKLVRRKSLTEEAYEKFRLAAPEYYSSVASDIAHQACNRAVKVLRASSKNTMQIAELCRDILAKVAASGERKPVVVVNTELAKELSCVS